MFSLALHWHNPCHLLPPHDLSVSLTTHPVCAVSFSCFPEQNEDEVQNAYTWPGKYRDLVLVTVCNDSLSILLLFLLFFCLPLGSIIATSRLPGPINKVTLVLVELMQGFWKHCNVSDGKQTILASVYSKFQCLGESHWKRSQVHQTEGLVYTVQIANAHGELTLPTSGLKDLSSHKVSDLLCIAGLLFSRLWSCCFSLVNVFFCNLLSLCSVVMSVFINMFSVCFSWFSFRVFKPLASGSSDKLQNKLSHDVIQQCSIT